MKSLISILLILFSITAIGDEQPPISTPSLLEKLTLTNAEILWKENNRDLKIVGDQVKASDADRLLAMQKPNPQLSINTGSLTGTNLKSTDTIVRVDQTFERGNKRELRMQAANLKVGAAKMDFQDASRQGRIAVDQAYFDLKHAQEALLITEENTTLYTQSLKAAKLRLTSGDIASSEFARIEVDALRAENDVQQAKNDLHQAQLALAYMIGEESQASRIYAYDEWPQLFQIPEIDPSLIESRPDVKSAQIRLQAAEAARDLATSLKTRDITLGVQYERNGSNLPMHSVGFGISIPLMTGYEYQGEIAHAEVDWQAAVDNLDRVRALALTDIENTRSNLVSAVGKLQNFDKELLNRAKESLESSEFAYQHGALSVMDLLDARRTYKATLLEASSARTDYAKAWSAWQYATGASI